MKITIHIITALMLIASVAYCHAQEKGFEGMYFNDFVTGNIFFSDGSTVDIPLNYNSLDEQVVFLKDNEILAIANYKNIDSIVVNKTVFVHGFGEAFFEKVKVADQHYYIRYKSVMISKGKGSAYGSYSETTSITNFESGTGSNGRYNSLQINEAIRTNTSEIIYLKPNKDYIAITNLKKLIKIFKPHKAVILEFSRKNHIDFDETDDIKKIVVFCLTGLE
ncbi:hypothetical protein [Saccharicrinis sp. FJH54]|uniref:hypothetical protein n=1 Tax=Saccharicrinis sp. FJH54 TaxID=3344665 RepID=UPI0035D42072